MTTAQKVIKYLAIAFAIFLVVTIISAILGTIYGLASVLGVRKNEGENVISELSTVNFENTDVSILNVDVAFTNLIIKTGDTLRIDTNNENLECKQNAQSLEIKEKSYNLFGRNNEGDLIIYVPEDMEFDEVKISAGAGKVEIESIKAKELDFDLGAGETEIKSLIVTKECDIDGGAGKVSILSGTINNLDLSLGVGETNLTAMINGKSDIDAGVGNLNITLLGDKESYKIKTDKGLGSIKIDEKEIADSQIYGNGESYIEIDGGVGNIKVEFRD